MQEADFSYEVVIGEDCSTDGTRAIVMEYARAYREKIRVVLGSERVGARRNFARTLEACQGQYIALLDGDDYWTSPDKLRRQVEFLDRHPECAICFHDVIVVYEDGSRDPHKYFEEYFEAIPKRISTMEDLLKHNFIPACSTVFRGGLFRELPKWFYTAPFGDWPLHILNATHGTIGCIDEVLAAYRKHAGGMNRALEQRPWILFKGTAETFTEINAYLDRRYEKTITSMLQEQWLKTVLDPQLRGRLAQTRVDEVIGQFESWPMEFSLSDRERQHLVAEVCCRLGLERCRVRDGAKTRYWLMNALRHEPARIGTLRFWAVGVELLCGRRVAEWLRRWSRRILGRGMAR
jgi:hypothetical protein